MAQHDYIIANQSGAAFRADLNNALAAIVSQNSGNDEPSTTYAYMLWAEGDTGLLKIRNAANNDWVTIGSLADTGFGLLSRAGGALTGDLTLNAQNDLRFADSDSSNWVAFHAPATVASNVTWTLPAADGSADQTLATNGSGTLSFVDRSRLVRSTAVDATSGTSIDFTGIPSWVKRITVALDGVSTNGTSAVIVQLGDAGGIETSGYVSTSGIVSTGSIGTYNYTTGFGVIGTTAGSGRRGSMVLTNITANNWTVSGSFDESGLNVGISAGAKTLSDTLTSVRITTVGGADAFDAGTINILYEG